MERDKDKLSDIKPSEQSASIGNPNHGNDRDKIEADHERALENAIKYLKEQGRLPREEDLLQDSKIGAQNTTNSIEDPNLR